MIDFNASKIGKIRKRIIIKKVKKSVLLQNEKFRDPSFSFWGNPVDLPISFFQSEH